MNSWGKIMVGARLEKTVADRFVEVWSHLLSSGLRPGDKWCITRGKVAHRAANSIVRELLASECDSLFFLDSDADIEPDFLSRFRDFEDGWGYDVLQSFYTRRGWPPEAIWFQRDAAGVLHKAYVLDEITEPVALVGLHACLIRRSVFEKLLGDKDPKTFDWFYYPRNALDTEDAAFSADALRAGFKVGATTAVKAGHISNVTIGWETYQQYLYASGQIERIAFYNELMPLVMDFTGLSEMEVAARVARGAANVTEKWGAEVKDAGAARAFYGEDDNGYLFDLFNWNTSPYYIQLTRPLQNYRGETALVIGGGLGTESVLLDRVGNDVVVFELPGVLRRFLEKRRLQEGHGYSILTTDCIEDLNERHDQHYTLVVAVDVIEHVHPDEIAGFLGTIDRLLASGGVLFTHVNFGQQDIYPMHYDHTQAFTDFVSKHGYIRESETTWRKPGKGK